MANNKIQDIIIINNKIKDIINILEKKNNMDIINTNKIQEINNFLFQNNCIPENIPKSDLDIIYNLYKNNNLDQTKKYSGDTCNYIGLYFEIKNNFELAQKYYLLAIKQNNKYAAHNLGCYYKHIKNFQDMEKYLLLSLNKFNYSNSARFLANYYFQNNDIPQAIKYYQIGAQKNNIVCIIRLTEYYKSQGDNTNYLKYLYQSNSLTDTDSLYGLGKYYFKQKNFELAKKYLEPLVTNNHDKSAYMLGIYYYNINNKLYEKYFQIAEINNNCHILFKIGLFFRDIPEFYYMEKYYLKSAKLNHAVAANNLGFYYEKNNNFPQAEQYYKLAISLYCPTAVFNLAEYYYKIEDYSQAKIYFEMEPLDLYTILRLAKINQKLNNPENIIKYYLLAVEQNHTLSLYKLGKYFEKNKDIDNMLKYYTLALDNMLKYYTLTLDKELAKKDSDIIIDRIYQVLIGEQNFELLLELLLKYGPPKIYELFSSGINFNKFKISEKFLNLIKQIPDTYIQVPILLILKNLLNNQVDLMDLHFKYSENGLGFKEAMEDFYSKILKNN